MSAAPASGSSWLDYDGLAELLGCGVRFLQAKVASREFPFHRVGRHVRFTPADVEAIERLTAAPPLNTIRAVS